MTQLNKDLTQAIHELIPEAGLMGWCMTLDVSAKECEKTPSHPEAMEHTHHANKEPLLRHVLWALGKVNECGLEYYKEDELHMTDGRYDGYWNLQHNLYQQSPELKEWLLSLLSKN